MWNGCSGSADNKSIERDSYNVRQVGQILRCDVELFGEPNKQNQIENKLKINTGNIIN